MNFLVTGANGFIGRNLIEWLKSNYNQAEIFDLDKETDLKMLKYFTETCDFVFNFAAVHRPEEESEFKIVNHLFFANLLAMLRSYNNSCPVLLTSSIQAVQDSAYGKSKLAAEKELEEHAGKMNSRAIIYRLTNTFGRYAKPNNHSVVATFCHNIAHGLPIVINDPDRIMKLYYIDDVISSFIAHIKSSIEPDVDGFYRLPWELEYHITLKELADKIYLFKDGDDKGLASVTTDEFGKKLYETYLSYNT